MDSGSATEDGLKLSTELILASIASVLACAACVGVGILCYKRRSAAPAAAEEYGSTYEEMGSSGSQKGEPLLSSTP